MCIPICIPCDDEFACCLCGSLTALCCCCGGDDRRDRRDNYHHHAPDRVVYVQPVAVHQGPPHHGHPPHHGGYYDRV
eukprot:jgi/Phyca11/550669/estExt2_Genewise1Plus.C_PHYCAscaffold_380135